MQRWCDWIEDLLTRRGILTSDNIHRANRVGLYLRKMWLTGLAARSSLPLFIKEAVVNRAFGVVAVVATLIAITQGVWKDENGDPVLSINPGAWVVIIVFSLLVGAYVAFNKVRKERDIARAKFWLKSANLRLARDLEDTYRTTPAAEILRLKKRIHYTEGSPTVEQVEDVRHRWICYIKNDRDMLIGAPEEAAFGYQDTSEEMVRILDLDASDISGSLNALSDDVARFANRKYSAIESLRASAAAITTNSSSD